jgi:hypothetical protein
LIYDLRSLHKVASVVYNYTGASNPKFTLFRAGFASPLQRQTSVYLQGCESIVRPF